MMSTVVADPDAALMLRVKQGDREAFAELVEKYKQPVINLAYRTLSDAAEAEDLARQQRDREKAIAEIGTLRTLPAMGL